ncbi:anthranilate phosphoribosyltransferase [Phakopsora pachyrhizi]|uniref:Anthranilate phosphoribosyltransferase n=1 Tax=Phakopsora pachyrhizi TaxID=170000 RepID=A0AAV0AS35_PHAPC|nr:anthranilate phosphoribosyltransferase [Phakopsora pachyrhizi]CAH7683298.1 anthranilate phosphoribosyltransferase [Phakopsora pachyrhizi]
MAQRVRLSSLLTSISLTGLDKHPKLIATFVDEIFGNWNHGNSDGVKIHEIDRSARPICDIVGTGGDGFNTFNVSTTAAIVAAGAGLKVCKHGNRASSSASGSADLLITLGIPLDRLTPHQVSSLVKDPETDFSFLFSQTFYPIFKKLGPIRKSLGFPTIFNRLGPLLNPIRPDRMIIGISDPKLGPTYCEVLKVLGLNHSWVVCGDKGLDEISTSGPTSLWKLNEKDGTVEHLELDPVKSFGLSYHPMERLITKDPKDSLKTLDLLLDHSGDQNFCGDINQIAKLDFVLMNASALLVLGGSANDYKQGVELARESLRSGRAREALEKFKVKSLTVVSNN